MIRILSIIVALVDIILFYKHGEFVGILLTTGYVIFPLACIWFPEKMGNFTGGYVSRITSRSPAVLVVFMGWILLMMPALLYFVVK